MENRDLTRLYRTGLDGIVERTKVAQEAVGPQQFEALDALADVIALAGLIRTVLNGNLEVHR